MADRKDLCGKRCIDTSTVSAYPKITNDEHKDLFDSYWLMNCDQRRTYIGSTVTSRIPHGNPQTLKKSCILKHHFLCQWCAITCMQKVLLTNAGNGRVVSKKIVIYNSHSSTEVESSKSISWK